MLLYCAHSGSSQRFLQKSTARRARVVRGTSGHHRTRSWNSRLCATGSVRSCDSTQHSRRTTLATAVVMVGAMANTGGSDAHVAPQPVASAGGGTGAKAKRFAVFVAGHTVPEVTERAGHFGIMLERLLREHDDEVFDFYFICDNEFPTDHDLAKYDGIVVSGSKHDAFADDDWIVKSRAVLRAAHARQQRVLAVCFGHQLIATAFGGKAGRAAEGWELGTRRVTTTAALHSMPYAHHLPTDYQYNVHEVHQDQILELPTDAVLFGSSSRTPIELYGIGENILCVQGHPEFDDLTVRQLIDARLDTLAPEVVDSARHSMEVLPISNGSEFSNFRKLCLQFLKG